MPGLWSSREQLKLEVDDGNKCNHHSVAVMKNGHIVRYIPHSISTYYSHFYQATGNVLLGIYAEQCHTLCWYLVSIRDWAFISITG